MHVRGLIRRSFTEKISAHDRARLREHLRGCEQCRDEYDQLAELMRAAAGCTPTRTETAALHRAVSATLFGPAGAAARPAPAVHSRFLRPLTAALTCGLALVLGYLALSTPPSPYITQYRGGDHAPLVSFEVFAVQRRGEGYTAPRLVSSQEVIGLDEFIQFRYRNSEPHLKHLYLLGLDQRFRPMDYFPRPDQDRSIAIRPTVDGEVISPSIILSQRHHEGTLWIHALFSEAPLTRAAVHGWVAAAERSAASDADPGEIRPGPGIVLRTQRFTLRRGDGR